MARRPRAAGVDPFADLAKKIEILEREMAVQRIALDKLKQMGAPRAPQEPTAPARVRKTA
jgi:hypothetical protein